MREEKSARVLRGLRPGTLHKRDERSHSLGERMAQFATPGASIAVIDDFSIAWAHGFGTRTIATGEKVEIDTPFQAASISKVVFALAVMRLVQKGDLELDVDVNTYLTSWRVPDNDGWQPRITLRQLLSHTAGTTVHGFPGYPSSGPWPSVIEILSGIPPSNTPPVIVDLLPSIQFRYSGGGTTIAQLALVDRLKQPFPKLMRDLILEPLQMNCSTFEQPMPTRFSARAASGHPWNGVPIQGGWHIYPEMAAAGLWTTAQDLSRLGVEVMRILRGEPSALGLEPETVAAMLRPQLPNQKPGQEFIGLGWFCDGKDAQLRCRHQGSNHGFVSEMVLFPISGKGAVVLLNSNQGAPLRDEIIGAIGREYDWPAAASSKPVSMSTNKDYVGIYSGSGILCEVVQAEQALLLRTGEQPFLRLEPISDTEFAATAVNLRVTFERDAGDGMSITLLQDGNAIKLSKTGR